RSYVKKLTCDCTFSCLHEPGTSGFHMARRYHLERIQVVTLGTLVAFGMGLTSEGAGARSLRSRQIPEAPQNTMSSAPIMAIVSIASQRVSLYDPNGGV